MMSENMRGLFFIVKGNYKKGASPSFINRVTEDTMYIGGFDPYSEDTPEWYMVFDNKMFNCICCGSDLDKMTKGVYNTIKRYKGDANKYFKFVKTNRELYKHSPIMAHLHEEVYNEYGDFFNDIVGEMEDLAYEELKEERPFHKNRKLVSKNKKTQGVGNTVKKEEKVEIDTTTPIKVKPKVKLGVKKLKMG